MKKSIQELEREILRHKELYYAGKPTISDHEYDELEEQLRALDPENFALLLVGSGKSGSGKKVEHETPMLSLQKTYSLEELVAWKKEETLVGNFKLDGISCSLIYEQGRLVLAKTRGNGRVGEDITDKVFWMPSVPKRIAQNDKVEVRGEIYCGESSFFHLGQEMERQNLERPSSKRNIVAGLMGRKDHIDLSRFLSFAAFDLITSQKLSREEQKYEILKINEFVISEIRIIKTQKDIEELIEMAKEFMEEGEFQIDGLVFSYNDLSLHRDLGATAHHPRYKIAFKFAGESKTTRIEEIKWQVSRNRILTPVAIVEPIELSGAMISRVTLHNYSVVAANNLKAGDEIEIIRSGEVIPKFLEVKNSAEGKFELPKDNICPACGKMSLEVEDIRLVCRNEYCVGAIKESMLHFIKKMEIDDLSEKRLELLLEKRMIHKISDLYELSIGRLMELPKVKEKLAQKLYDSIQKSRQVNLVKFLAALGLKGGAENTCEKIIAGGFDSIGKLQNASIEDLIHVEGIAEKSAKDLLESLHERQDMISDLVEIAKLDIFVEKKEIQESELTGKKICITGALSRKRDDIEKDLKSFGAIPVGSVSKNTDYLVTNDQSSGSSKLKNAQKLGIPILTEEELYLKMKGDEKNQGVGQMEFKF